MRNLHNDSCAFTAAERAGFDSADAVRFSVRSASPVPIVPLGTVLNCTSWDRLLIRWDSGLSLLHRFRTVPSGRMVRYLIFGEDVRGGENGGAMLGAQHPMGYNMPHAKTIAKEWPDASAPLYKCAARPRGREAHP